MSSSTESDDDLRARLREQRRAVEMHSATEASERAVTRLLALPEIQEADRVALYLACDGEIDPAAATATLRDMGRLLAAPTFQSGEMSFADLGEETREGRFGISEPVGGPVELAQIDVVVAPLVAFDESGTRLGRGAGYYDAVLAHLLARSRPAVPFVVGFAYDFQQVEQLKRERHDVPLDAVATPSKVWRFG